MSSLDFPLNPIDGQEYSLNGVTYYYNAALGAWLTKLSSAPLPTAFNRQVLFNDAGLSNGSYGLVFDKSANTLFANTINVSSNMRVFGNLQIGTGTVTITNNSISAASIIVGGSAIPSGAAANLAFDTANAAYGLSNTTNTFAYGVAVNAAAAFAAANNVGPQIAPAFNTANAAFNTTNASFTKANTALQNTSGTFAGNLSVSGNLDLSLSSSYLKLPVGTTLQRPAGASGMVRFNTTTAYPEWYDNTTSNWVAFNKGIPYEISVLIVAGGGGGGIHSGGGGGAGGLLYYGYESPKTPNGANVSINSGTTYNIVVGAGGSGSGGNYQAVTGNGYDGGSSSAFGYTAIGGGGGGSGGNGVNGRAGGSGGGGGRDLPGGSGTAGQGNAGGYWGVFAANYPGGGGGGASAAGTGGNGSAGGNGGNGYAYSISGSSTYYAGGGGGNLQYGGTQGTGGLGGGANGSTGNGYAGTNNTGGGGGGAEYTSSGGGQGGSGIVIISYPGGQRASGGTVTSSGGRTIHTFTSSGTFTA